VLDGCLIYFIGQYYCLKAESGIASSAIFNDAANCEYYIVLVIDERIHMGIERKLPPGKSRRIFMFCTHNEVVRGSSVGIVTDYGLDGPVIE
jgi:hypothetical protein